MKWLGVIQYLCLYFFNNWKMYWRTLAADSSSSDRRSCVPQSVAVAVGLFFP